MQACFNSWHEFLSMGGYGFFVWGAYGALIMSFSLGVFLTRRQYKQRLQKNTDESTP